MGTRMPPYAACLSLYVRLSSSSICFSLKIYILNFIALEWLHVPVRLQRESAFAVRDRHAAKIVYAISFSVAVRRSGQTGIALEIILKPCGHGVGRGLVRFQSRRAGLNASPAKTALTNTGSVPHAALKFLSRGFASAASKSCGRGGLMKKESLGRVAPTSWSRSSAFRPSGAAAFRSQEAAVKENRIGFGGPAFGEYSGVMAPAWGRRVEGRDIHTPLPIFLRAPRSPSSILWSAKNCRAAGPAMYAPSA